MEGLASAAWMGLLVFETVVDQAILAARCLLSALCYTESVELCRDL